LCERPRLSTYSDAPHCSNNFHTTVWPQHVTTPNVLKCIHSFHHSLYNYLHTNIQKLNVNTITIQTEHYNITQFTIQDDHTNHRQSDRNATMHAVRQLFYSHSDEPNCNDSNPVTASHCTTDNATKVTDVPSTQFN